MRKVQTVKTKTVNKIPKYSLGKWTIHPTGDEHTGLIHPSGLFGIKGKSVTHIPTGLSFGVLGFPTQRQAKEFVEAVVGILDWSTITLANEVEIVSTIGLKVKELRQQFGYQF